MNPKKSSFSGFHRLSIEERLRRVAEQAGLDGKLLPVFTSEDVTIMRVAK